MTQKTVILRVTTMRIPKFTVSKDAPEKMQNSETN
jgi:hypothetical protein